MSKLVLLVVCALALTSAVLASPHHKRHHHEEKKAGNSPASFFADPHPITDASNIDAKWAAINARLKANNYRYNVSGVNDGAYGVDLSQWAGEDTFTCFMQNGYDFAVVRAYQSNCQVDPNGVHTVANAWAAGVAHVDIYLFPALNCGSSAAQQVADTINNMGSIPFGMIWFDIEASGSGWSSDPDQNHAWLVEGINQAVSMIGSSRIGIYSSAYGWSTAMGTYSDLSSYPLWYAHYDGSPSFGDFSSFGGWSTPSIKQYTGDASICSFDVDLNWYP